MARFQRLLAKLILTAVLLVVTEAAAGDPDPSGCRGLTGGRRYSRVFGFGNSLTDTGNSVIFPPTAGGTFTQPPYGETYPGHPSGRASDGRLIIDFLVEKLKVPQPTPYLAGRTAADFVNGTNFAIGGATALDPAFLQSRGVTTFVPVSLSNETRWFENVLQLLGSSRHEQLSITASSVFYVGEMGVNDYFLSLLSNHTIDEAASLVPHVVGAIRSALTAMITAGAKMVLVTGMAPLGCAPYLLALFPGGAGDYDPVCRCNTRLNGLAELHNRELRRALDELWRARPGRALLYGDVYGPVAGAVATPAEFGFGDAPLAACCGGGGGLYNFNFTTFCGAPGSTACADPSKSISWDGIHFTEAANKFIAGAILSGG